MTAGLPLLRRWSPSRSRLCAGAPFPTLLRAGASRLLACARPLLPQACVLCRAPSGAALLCMACFAGLPSLRAACPHCALPGGFDTHCAHCRRHAPPWSRAAAAWTYDFPVDRLVQQLKYGGRLALADPLGHGVAMAVRACGAALPDAIVPLPLAPARQRHRGFNQAQLIARVSATALQRPLLHALRRVRDDDPQAALGQQRRAANMRGAFVARHTLRGLHVAVVDDVMTTGATLAAATLAAYAAGARVVDVHVVARTLPP